MIFALAQTHNAARDVVLHIGLDTPAQSYIMCETNTDAAAAAAAADDAHAKVDGALMATFFPSFSAPPLQVELVFLVDCSSTMRGATLERARAILRLALDKLPADCYFNIVSFGPSAACLFADSVLASKENVERALAFVDELRALDGAVDVYRILDTVHETKAVADGWHKQVLLLTDGVVAYTVDVLDIIQEMSAAIRTFVFDLGTGLAHHVAQAIAQAGLGAVEYAADNEDLDDKGAWKNSCVVLSAC